MYSFLHRSFQEYFVAVFLADRRVPRMGELFLPIASRFPSDSVISLLIEMNKEAFEEKYFAPLLGQLRKEIERVSGTDGPSHVLSLFASEFGGNSRHKAERLTPEKWLSILRMALSFYIKSEQASRFANTDKRLWDELAVKLLSLKGAEADGTLNDEIKKKKRKKINRSFIMPVADIPEEVLRQTKLYRCLMVACEEIEKLDGILKRNLSQKTDLVGDLLKQFQS